MASEWIKMRSELWTHPRFLYIANALTSREDICRGFLVYVCGEDILKPEVMSPSNESVTERALRRVTRQTLREVTMCALLRVWCSVNAHCKVDGTDAICHPMTLKDLDDIAGFDGLGEAMAESGWVECLDGENALLFRNFLEFNEPACLRKKPKSNAERQAAFRARKMDEKQSHDGVTKVTKSNAREEKSRQEVNTPLCTPPKEKSKAVTLTAWLADIKAKGEKPVSDYAPLWGYVDKVGLPRDFVELAWLKFKARFTQDEKGKRKRYVLWRDVFLKAVAENWFRLWFYVEADQGYRLTTSGVQADKATLEEAAA